ncbi:hypothetical protein DL768_005609 [Monosporascus sp. mg162]|nr:hypothetical protein DL768_005609 [Monosporascus sp. mg162]
MSSASPSQIIKSLPSDRAAWQLSMEGANPGDPPVNRGAVIVGTICAVTALSTAFAAARLFVRSKYLGKLLLDDYLIIISVLCAWLTVGFQVMSVRAGNGKPTDMLTPEEKAGVMRWSLPGFVLGTLSITMPKFAVVALLTRILDPSLVHRVFLWCLVGVCLIQLTVAHVLSFIKCSEDGTHPRGRCEWTRSRQYYDIYVTGDWSDITIWTCSVEASTIIIASCVPVLKPLVDLIRGGFTKLGSSNKYRRNSRNISGEREQGEDMQLETIGQKRTRDIRAPGVDVAPVTSESQENILCRTQPSGGIIRTDHIVVSHEEAKSDDMNVDIWNDGKRV